MNDSNDQLAMDGNPLPPPPPLEDLVIPPLPPPLPSTSNLASDCGNEESALPTLTVSISKNVDRRNVTFLQSDAFPEPERKRQKLNCAETESAGEIKVTLQRSEKGAMRRTQVTVDGDDDVSNEVSDRNDSPKEQDLLEMPDDMVVLEEDDDDADSWASGIDVDAMLEADYNERISKEKEETTADFGMNNPDGIVAIKHKIVLKEKGHEPIEGLPDGWVQIAHDSGMHLYLHRSTRVCVWSRPYLLGNGSARRHKVPVTSIPCLHYKRELKRESGEIVGNDSSSVQEKEALSESCQEKLPSDKEALSESGQQELLASEKVILSIPDQEKEDSEKEVLSKPNQEKLASEKDALSESSQEKENKTTDEQSTEKLTTQHRDGKPDENGAVINGEAKPIVADKIHVCKDESVDAIELHNYLIQLFEFQTLTVKKFRTYADKRRHNKQLKGNMDRPQLPGTSSLITCQIPGSDKSGKGKKDFVINSKDKTPVCILHEYAQRVMKMQPKYIYKECENMSTPFEAIAEIDGTQYGKGAAISKKNAKNEAARATLDILIPNLCLGEKNANDTDDLEYFNNILIEDTRVYELCNKAGQLTPWMMLQEYKQRHHGQEDMELEFNVQVSKHQRSTYTLNFGQHVVTGQCKNKKVGKQHGAQKILKLLHPHLKYWGSLIKIYRKGASIRNKEKKEAEQSIILLQAKTKNKPNEKILNKLKVEMLKMYGERFEKMKTPNDEGEKIKDEKDEREDEESQLSNREERSDSDDE